MLELGIKTLIAYLLGSVIGGLLLGHLRGVDIREQGSGNAGGTNALRTQGWKFALGVVVIDVGKAILAVGVLPGLDLPMVGIDPSVARDWLETACGTAVVVGHVYPVWYEFRGGKGAATLIGARDFGAAIVEKVAGQRLYGGRPPRAADQSFFGHGVPSLFMSPSEQPADRSEGARAYAQLMGGATRSGGLGWWWHTTEDTLDKVSADSLAQVGQTLLGWLEQEAMEP